MPRKRLPLSSQSTSSAIRPAKRPIDPDPTSDGTAAKSLKCQETAESTQDPGPAEAEQSLEDLRLPDNSANDSAYSFDTDEATRAEESIRADTMGPVIPALPPRPVTPYFSATPIVPELPAHAIGFDPEGIDSYARIVPQGPQGRFVPHRAQGRFNYDPSLPRDVISLAKTCLTFEIAEVSTDGPFRIVHRLTRPGFPSPRPSTEAPPGAIVADVSDSIVPAATINPDVIPGDTSANSDESLGPTNADPPANNELSTDRGNADQ